ncbi:MAG: prepilin-type N-terminal cleavage/methylation domain-containing protein [Gemmatimonadota bacterium]
MSARRGFTLVEVMVALLIGGVVVLLAYSTLTAGLDVQQRVATARESDASASALRAMLGDAIRHAVPGDAESPRGLHLTRGADGQPALSLVTRGVDAPMGGSGAWQVLLATDTSGLTLSARSRDGSRGVLRLSSRGTRRLDVRFLPIASSEWRAQWDDATRLPDAVEVRFLDRQGREVMPPLVARTAPVSGA